MFLGQNSKENTSQAARILFENEAAIAPTSTISSKSISWGGRQLSTRAVRQRTHLEYSYDNETDVIEVR